MKSPNPRCGERCGPCGRPSPGPCSNSIDKDRQTSQPSYVAHITLPAKGIESEQGFTDLEPGMAVTAEIKTGKCAIIDFLLSPLQRMKSESFQERRRETSLEYQSRRCSQFYSDRRASSIYTERGSRPASTRPYKVASPHFDASEHHAMTAPAPDLHPAAIELMSRMTDAPPSHHRFKGHPIDPEQLDALTLGDLWAVATATKCWDDHRQVQSLAAETARAILCAGHKKEPVFRGPALRDYLDVLASRAEKDPPNDLKIGARYVLKNVRSAIARCIDLASEGIGEAAKRYLTAVDWLETPHTVILVARLADADFQTHVLEKLAAGLAGSPLLVDELRTVAGLDWSEALLVADMIDPDWKEDDVEIGNLPHPLSGLLPYAALSETALKSAAERVRRIHAFEIPYASDKAFTLGESAVIARLTRVALDRDEVWIPPVLDELFLKVSLAPTAAKTVPSQSVAIALGHCVEAFPTPEAVATLRQVLRDLRHAGVEKKLQRNLRIAQRGLASRPAIALRMPPDQPMTKAELGTLKLCLEASFATAMVLDDEDWRAHLAEHPDAKNLAGSLVWRILDGPCGGIAVLPVTERGGVALRDAGGALVTAGPGHRVTLWHPADAPAHDRNAWRDRLAALRIKQPFKQVFREHYAVPADERSQSKTTMFSGHAVSIRPFIGLARREGWRLGHDQFVRTFGQYTVKLDLEDHIYPGATGWTVTRAVSVWKAVDRKLVPASLDELPIVTLSEVLRSVDLLVSTSGFGVTQAEEREPEDRERQIRMLHLAQSPLGAMAEMRKQALERALGGREGMAGLHFDARHLRLGPYAIHLATGRVTRDGEQVTIETPKRANLIAVPWLPYDEKLLERIAYTAMEIAQRGEG